ncbi:amidohydrolase 3 [Pisolithus microcarpus]|nr:amidohydrolase 3 [Pisolithus microcarpus]
MSAETWMALVAVALVLGAVFYGPPRPTSCILVRDTRIADVGSLCLEHSQLIQHSGHHDPLLDVSFIDPTSIVVPGLVDAHAHILSYGSSKLNVLERLVDSVKARPDILNDPSKCIQWMGWDHNIWAVPEYPHADDFDAEPLLRGRRIHLDRIDCHVARVSRRVLQLMGELPNIVIGGQIVRDGSANPTSILMDKAKSLIPVLPPSKADMLRYFDGTIKDALAVGLTSIHDASTDPDAVESYKQCMKNSRYLSHECPIPSFSVFTLQLRLCLMGHLSPAEYWGDKLPRLVDYGIGGRFNLRGIELFVDGILGPSGAAPLELYSDNPATTGIMRIQEDVLSDLHLCLRGFHVRYSYNTHCSGDRTNRAVLDIFEDVFSGTNMWEARPRIEHAQIMAPEDLERMVRLDVIPSVQPTHANMWYAEQRLGPERILGAYAYRTMIQAFMLQSLGSRSLDDLRVALKGGALLVRPTSANLREPLLTVTDTCWQRRAKKHLPSTQTIQKLKEGDAVPEQRLTRFQALKCMTMDAADASFSESVTRSLTMGKKADFVVLDRDIMIVPESEVLGTKVLATVTDGEVVYGDL